MSDSLSPTQRALKYFRDRGGECVILTCFPKYGNRRKDVWGADFLVRRGKQLIAVQASDETSHGKHVTKAIQADSPVRNWLEAEVPYYVFSVGLRGPAEDKMRIPRITEIVYFDGYLTQRELEAHKIKAEDTPA